MHEKWASDLIGVVIYCRCKTLNSTRQHSDRCRELLCTSACFLIL